jgi:HEPN domain-containing protein
LPSCEEMNRIADRWLESNNQFASRVDAVIRCALEEEPTTHDEAKKLLEELAKARLISEFSWVSRFPVIEKYVLLMIKDQQEFEGADEKKPWMIERLVSSLQKVCEALVKILSPPSDKHDEWKKVYFKDEFASRGQIKAVYRCCAAVDDELAHNFSRIRSGQIRAAMRDGNQSLRQLLAAMVLRIPDQVMEIERAVPDWLNQAIALAESRNKAEHANEHVVDESVAYHHLKFVETLLKYIEGSIANG